MKFLALLSVFALGALGHALDNHPAQPVVRRLSVETLATAAYSMGRYMAHHPELFDKGVAIDHSTDSDIITCLNDAIVELNESPITSATSSSDDGSESESHDDANSETVRMDETHQVIALMTMALHIKEAIAARQE